MNRRLTNLVKDYFSFSNREKGGISLLLIILFISILIKIWLPNYYNKANSIEFEKFSRQIVFSDTTTNTHVKKEKKSKTDSKPEYTPAIARKPSFPTCKIIELNTADTADLEKLPGIGPVLSKRIIKFRDKLGGFYSTEQLLEVYGIKEDVFIKIIKQVKTDTTYIHKFDMNLLSFQELNSNPYITYEQTKALMKLKAKMKLTIDNVRNSGIFSVNEFEKLQHYLAN